jgi:1-acyl-sn-glycerol-3-phosphate acyltransferase
MHWEIPFWRQLIKNIGMVPGTREGCAALMDAGEHILVFPGGRREVCKQKGEAYQLIWRNRTGFAHMAVAHGYDIIPVAAIGGEEMFDILVDSREVMSSPIGAWLQNSGLADRYLNGGENLPPIVKGVGRSLLPKPQRHYIMVGDRIDTTRFNGHIEGDEMLMGVRKEVEEAFVRMFDALKEHRAGDKDEEWWRKILKRV